MPPFTTNMMKRLGIAPTADTLMKVPVEWVKRVALGTYELNAEYAHVTTGMSIHSDIAMELHRGAVIEVLEVKLII